MRMAVEDSRTGKLIKLDVKDHHKMNRIIDIIVKHMGILDDPESFCLVLNGRELPNYITIGVARQEWGLKENDKLALWKRIREHSIWPEDVAERCTVCKANITGIKYTCPTCQTKYCFNCYKALKQKGDNCWICNKSLGDKDYKEWELDPLEKEALEKLEEEIGDKIPILIISDISEVTFEHSNHFGAWIQDNHVFVLGLSGANLEEVPDELIIFNKLKMLDLSKNELTSIPIFFQEFESLEGIDLGYNRFFKIPKTILQCEYLEQLDMRGNSIISLQSLIENLKSLTHLNLSKNNLKYIPKSIGGLKNLEILNLSHNRLKSIPEEMGNIKSLISLNLSHNNLNDIPQTFKNHEFVLSLNLSNNNFTSIPQVVEEMKYLNKLNFSGNKLESISDNIMNIDYLQSLNLENNLIETLPININIESQIQSLRLGNNRLKSLPESIGDLGNLINLDLSDNNITEIPESINNLDSLMSLNLENNILTSLPSSLNNLKQLQSLNLADNKLFSFPEAILSLESLNILYLENNKIKSLPESLEKLNSLEVLNLQNNFIELVPLAIITLLKLYDLNLADNRISEIPKLNKESSNLLHLNLSNNKIKELSKTFKRFTVLESLNLENNNLLKFQDEIIGIKTLKSLNLNFNQIDNLPEKIKELKCLKNFDILNNNLTIESWIILGEAYHKIKEYNKAINSFNKALEINPENSFALFNLGFSYEKLNKSDEAEKVYLKSLEINPELDKVLFNLGRLYIKKLKYREAIEIYKRYLNIDSKNFVAWYYFAKSLFSLEEIEAAADACMKCLNLSPNYRDCKDLYEQVLKILDERAKVKRFWNTIKGAIDTFCVTSRSCNVSDIIEYMNYKKLDIDINEMTLKFKIMEKIKDGELQAELDGNKIIFIKERDYIVQREEKRLEPKGLNLFLSYSTLDSEIFRIKEIAQHLEGFNEINKVFYWEHDSGENIVTYMEKTLKQIKVFILFCSENALKSKSVEGEWQAAYQLRQKGFLKIIPVHEKEEDVPVLLLPILNLKFSRENFYGFIETLYKEILRE